jgi:hypothetical protein
LFAEEFAIDLTVSSEELRLDQNLTVDLTLTFPPQYKFNAQSLPLNLLERGNFSEPPFKLISFDQTKKEENTQSFRFILEPQIVGYHPITFFDIPFSDGKELISPVKFVHVIASPLDTEYALPLAPMMTLDKHYTFHPTMGETRSILFPPKTGLMKQAQYLKLYKSIPWIEMSVVALALLLFYLFRNYTRSMTPEQRTQQAKIHAIEQIQSLREMRHPSNGHYDSYYASVTDIIRNYISVRYGIQAPKQTTKEFLAAMRANHLLDGQMLAEVQELFMRADEVKFANYSPSNEECVEAESTVRKLVFE